MIARPYSQLIGSAVIVTVLACILSAYGNPQLLDSPKNGVPSPELSHKAVFAKHVYVKPGQTLTNAWVLIHEDRIQSVFSQGEGEIPDGYPIHRFDEGHLYAGFIEPYLEVNVPTQDVNRPGQHWNPRIQPARKALDGELPNSDVRDSLRKAGFGVAHVVPSSGLVRGQSGILSLGEMPGDRSESRPPLIDGLSYQSIAFESGPRPNSLMGQIAAIRQTFLDAEYHARSGGVNGPNALSAIRIERSHPINNSNSPTSFTFEGADEVDLLRAEKIFKKFGIQNVLLRGNGTSYKRTKALSGKYPIIVPLEFPKAPSVNSIGEQESVDLRDLMHWEHAPHNFRYLIEASIPAFLTSNGKPDDFLKSLQKVHETGVDAKILLESLTTGPASALHISDEVGSVQAGFRANIIISDKSIFEKDSKLLTSIVDGHIYDYQEEKKPDFNGEWKVSGLPFAEEAQLNVKDSKSGHLVIGDSEAQVLHFNISGESLHFISRHAAFGDEPLVVFSAGLIEDGDAYMLSGRLTNLDGSGSDWFAHPKPTSEENAEESESKSEVDYEEEDQPSSPEWNWVGSWSGVAHGDEESQDINVSLYQNAEGNLYGTISADNRIIPIETIEFEGNELSGTVSPDRKYVHGYVKVTESGRLTGWSVESGNPEQQKISGENLNPSEEENPSVIGRWQVTVTSGEDLVVEPIIVINKTEGDYTGRAIVDGRSVEFTQMWVVGETADKDGIHFLLPTDENPELGDTFKLELELQDDSSEILGTVESNGEEISFVLDHVIRFASAEETGEESADSEEHDESHQSADEPFISPFALPFGPYSQETLPDVENVWIKGATIWTAGPAGTIEKGDLLLAEGKVAFVGSSKDAIQYVKNHGTAWKEMDGKGLHVTPGLIDCHSHTGISRGINEVGQAVTAEVDIGNSTNPDDVNWYRQLAGGLTTVNTLHGSANPIGGQNQVNKLRWGVPHPDQMHFKGSIEGIKFALGENVKRSTSRYPNTRMGVEVVFRERFQAAREYLAELEKFRKGELNIAPRRDLELDALSEILEGRRLIHCHSYRQDEILMLCRVAGEYGFKIGTFQHILEGYKVAEIIREHAIGGSAFSDWWAYKVEVQDAIPFAGAIMHKAGMVVSFNSDDTEMARRMNLEAAKAVKYGSLSEEEALQFVTLNPAKQLMIDDRVGSLEVGKDADFVIWNKHPFSTSVVCQSTWIDGREYFSIEKDKQLREIIRKERKRLISKIVGPAKKSENESEEEPESESESAQLAESSDKKLYSNPAEYWQSRMMQTTHLRLLELGIHPGESHCGECGLRGQQLIQK